MDLGPARPDEARPVRVVGDQEPVELDPVGGHALAELLDGPAALLGVAGEGPVVGVEPGLLVAAGHEGPGDQRPGGRARRRPPGGAGRASGGGRARGRIRARGRGRRRPVRPAWPRGGPGRSGGASATARPIRADATSSAPCRGRRDRRPRGATVEPSLAGESTAHPASPPSCAGEDDALRGPHGVPAASGQAAAARGAAGWPSAASARASSAASAARSGVAQVAEVDDGQLHVHVGQRNPVP